MSWLERGRQRSRREVITRGVVLVAVVGFVVIAYAVIVLGGGALFSDPTSAHGTLSILATAVVALCFDPVQTRLDALVSRSVYGGQLSPYEALRRFSGTLTGSEPAEALPARMAQVLAEGTGAEWSQVWIVVGEQPLLAATWPAGAQQAEEAADAMSDPREGEAVGRRWLPVSHGGELLGVLVVQEHKHVPLTSVEERLFAGLASQAGLVLQGARLHTELELRLAELSTRADELRSSRQRLVDMQDNERRLLERDIHDGAQQHLVALAVNLRLAQTLAARSSPRAVAVLAGQKRAAADAIATLVHLSQGIYPPLLGEAGLAAALHAAVGTSVIPVQITASGMRRYAADIEAAAYFCCLEALQNAAKHSGATLIRLSLIGDHGDLQFSIEDDGTGFEPSRSPAGNGLANMRDRIESVGGTLTMESVPGSRTRVQVWIPVAAIVPRRPDRDG
jgi:signal transduction histidine kinase